MGLFIIYHFLKNWLKSIESNIFCLIFITFKMQQNTKKEKLVRKWTMLMLYMINLDNLRQYLAISGSDCI